MESFIGIALPPDLRRKIIDFCSARQYTATEPYLVMLPSSLLGSANISEQKLESYCLSQSDFRLVITGPSRRGNQVLFLTVAPGTVNIMREGLAKHFKAAMTGSFFRPHITLMRQSAGKALDLERYLEEAMTVFEPYSFTVTQVTVFTRQDEKQSFEPGFSVLFMGR